MNVQFVVTRPASKARTFVVRLPLLVGRGEEAKFRIQQDRVSRKHCEFFEQDGRVYLRDLGSTNGTFLNGELIETSTKIPLEPGVLVKVGSLEFRIEFAADGSAPPPQPAPEAADGDKTVDLADAADSAPLWVEHETPEPAEPPPVILTAERPVTADDVPRIEVAADAAAEEAAPVADDAFGFLGRENPAASPDDDDQLGDFLKGLR